MVTEVMQFSLLIFDVLKKKRIYRAFFLTFVYYQDTLLLKDEGEQACLICLYSFHPPDNAFLRVPSW